MLVTRRAAPERELADERAHRLVAEQRLAELDRVYSEIIASRSWADDWRCERLRAPGSGR